MSHTNAGAASYDEVPYRGKPFRQTHPDNLSTIAHLLSVPAPEVRKARVLELGCSDGGNLLPVAVDLPEARFIGIDYSPVQIHMGREVIQQLGVRNLDLRDMSILDVGEDFGEFDYIICHGVFSWVPDEVAHKILDICARHLSPTGIAYVSYNCYPGWYMRAAVRDMMRYHALRFDGAGRRLQEARLLLDFASQHAHGFNAEAYGTALKSEAELLKPCPDHYLYHEHLEDHSRPYYFHEFAAQAASRGLAFLAESKLGAMALTNLSPAAQRAMSAIATNVIELEQFMDFLRNRTFRETLLHRAGVEPQYDIAPERLRGMYVTAMLRTEEKTIDLRPDKAVRFEGRSGIPVTTSNPIVKAALASLMNHFPLPMRFETLVDRTRHQMDRNGLKCGTVQDDARTLATGLLKIYMSADPIELSVVPPRFTIDAGERPLVSAYARRQAADPEVELLVTRRHDMIRLEATERKVAALLDGTRTAPQVAAETGETFESVLKAISHLERSAMILQG